jgi:hypothetical protein
MIATVQQMNNVGSLLQMRPPKTIVYRQIMSGTPEQIQRKKFCFATTWPFDQVINDPMGALIWIDSPNADKTQEYLIIAPQATGTYNIQSVQDPNDFNVLNPEPWTRPYMLPNGRYIMLPEVTIDFGYFSMSDI